MSTRKICVVVTARPSYSRIRTALQAIRQHPDLELKLVVAASALLDRYGNALQAIERDGFDIAARVYMVLEGENLVTSAKSTGLGLVELATVFDNLRPDAVVTIADRYETLANAVAAAYMNIPVAHTMGGEISGTIDESIRHAVTKLSHLHFPANRQAAERIIRMGEDPAAVFAVGCPRIDLVAEIARADASLGGTDWLEREGVGAHITLDRPFLLVSQHPVTTEYGEGERQITETLMALHELQMPTIMLWPNADAGSEDISRGMRKFREQYRPEYIRFYKNFPIETYVRLMLSCACAIGNSSAPLREGAFVGVPTVNVGTRQQGRDRAANVTDVAHDRNAIVAAVRQQIAHGRYPSDHLYGDGTAGPRMAEILATAPLRVQKRLTY